MPGSVLWMVHEPPLPAVSGSRVRSLALIGELAARGWDVSLFALDAGTPAAAADAERLGALCREARLARPGPGRARLLRMGTDLLRGRPFQHSMFRAPAAVREAHDWIGRSAFDAIVAVELYMLPYVPERALERTLLDSQNVDSERVATMAAALWPRPRGMMARLQRPLVERHEARAAAAVGGVLAVSGRDAGWFERHAPGRVTVVPNGVDCARVHPRTGLGEPGLVLFVGSMDYGANVEGALELLSEVAPRLRTPGARLALVGASPPPRLRRAAAAAPLPVEVTGRVERIEPWFRAGRVLAVPLRIGGGTRLKILEAIAHGVPVVTTTIGCEGLELEHERELLIADEPAAFARCVDRVLGDDELARALAARARETVARRYDWRSIGARLETAIAALGRR